MPCVSKDFACNAYYKLYYYTKHWCKVKHFLKKSSLLREKIAFSIFSVFRRAALLAIRRKFV